MAECNGKCQGVGSGMCWHGHRFQVSIKEGWTIEKTPECCPVCPKDKVHRIYQTAVQAKAEEALKDKKRKMLRAELDRHKSVEERERL